jgi:hypothetical protein
MKSTYGLMRAASWIFTMRRNICGKARRPGSMAVLDRHASGLAGHGITSAMVTRMMS